MRKPILGKWTDPNFKSSQTMCCPVNLLSFKLIRQSVFELESGNQNISDECTPKPGSQTDPSFESNQALVGQRIFELRSGNRNNFNECTLQKGKTEGAPILKVTKPWWYPINLLSFKLIRQTIFEFESGNQNVGRRTDSPTHQSNIRVGDLQPT